MKNKTLLLGAILVTSIMLATTAMAIGNGWSGYNDKARIFVGTCSQWCTQKPTDCGYCSIYTNDKITMKWNAAWDTCNAGGSCAGAWTDNEWNGKFLGGSGAVWHYKIKWIPEACSPEYSSLPDGGECIWGHYEIMMDQGVDPSLGTGHLWFAHAIPTGYGA